MTMLDDLSTLAPVIQLAVAPVFLLTAIAAFLTVLTNRLARIVDRKRYIRQLSEPLKGSTLVEKKVLIQRARLSNWAITACGLSALLVCIFIASLFLGSLLWVHSALFVSIIFVMAMGSLMIGLVLFLMEISLTIKAVRIIDAAG